MTMMLVFGRCLLLVVVTIEVSDACDDCSTAADVDVGEGDLTLLLDVSSPPSPSSPSRCDDDDLGCSCCCFLSRMSAMMSAVVLPLSCLLFRSRSISWQLLVAVDVNHVDERDVSLPSCDQDVLLVVVDVLDLDVVVVVVTACARGLLDVLLHDVCSRGQTSCCSSSFACC